MHREGTNKIENYKTGEFVELDSLETARILTGTSFAFDDDTLMLNAEICADGLRFSLNTKYEILGVIDEGIMKMVELVNDDGKRTSIHINYLKPNSFRG